MFEIIFLGTSAAAPSVYRGLTSQMILANEHRFLIDCGEGTQRQILKSGLGFRKLDKILITHSHLDHILGLGGLVSTLTRWESLDQIDIWAGSATLERIQNLLFGVVLIGQAPPVALNMHPLAPEVFLEDKKFTVEAFPVRHQGPGNFGFLFQERTRRPFRPERAKTLGIPAGPIRGELVAGKTVTLDDGRVIHPDDVLGKAMPGIKYVHVGDCGSTENLHDVAADADCLVIEATYVDEEIEMARQFGHLTAGQAARFAKEMGVKHLILTHISRRSFEADVRREAERYFPDTYVARDFDHFVLSREGGVQKLEQE